MASAGWMSADAARELEARSLRARLAWRALRELEARSLRARLAWRALVARARRRPLQLRLARPRRERGRL